MDDPLEQVSKELIERIRMERAKTMTTLSLMMAFVGMNVFAAGVIVDSWFLACLSLPLAAFGAFIKWWYQDYYRKYLTFVEKREIRPFNWRIVLMTITVLLIIVPPILVVIYGLQ